MNDMKPRITRRFGGALPCALIAMVFGYVLLHDLLGGTLFSHSSWDSYTLQALAWREGRLFLDRNFEWLELAIYNGRYYVSFPPLPSVVMLPLTFIFGENTPNNLVMIVYALLTTAFGYGFLRRVGTGELASAVTASFIVFGSNMLWMSTNGGVWFQAQGLNLLLLTCCAYCASYDKRALAYALAALAVGCRPFSVCAFIPLFVCFCRADGAHDMRGALKSLYSQLACFIIPALIACCYLWYNYARFDNVFEFGHNYLPEFTSSEHGQFYIGYLLPNLKNLFLRPVTVTASGRLSFTYFDSFMFYIANPIFLITGIRAVKNAFCRRIDAVRVALLVSIALEIVLLCMHKTLGGWQFGARYTVDMIPAALCYIALRDGGFKPRRYEYLIMACGVLFNIYGTLAMTYFFE